VFCRKHALIFSLVMSMGAACQAGQWTTFGHDPQRSGYAQEEHSFSPANIASMGLLWKTTVPNEPLFLNGLTAPLLVTRRAAVGGPKNLVIVAGTSDHIFALNAESGELAWKADFQNKQPRPSDGGWLCPTGLNATPVIDEPRGRVFVLSSDGKLHTLSLADGHEAMPPAQFVAPYAKVWSLNYVGNVVYVSLSQDCNHVKSGVAAINPDQPGRPVVQFYSAIYGGAGIWGRGGVSIGFDGFVYGATGDAPFDPAANEFGDTVLKLVPRTLELTGYYTPETWQYITRRDLDMGTTTPAIFRWRGHVLTASGGKEGAIYVTDTEKMSGSDHHQTAYISPRYTNAAQTFEGQGIWGAFSSWQDGDHTWLYVPTWGVPTAAAQFPVSYGAVTDGSLMAFTVEPGPGNKPVLKPAWISANIAVPDPAAIAGGIVFVLGTGEDTQQVNHGDIHQLLGDREKRSNGHAILHALDARTGKELWSSGEDISGWTHFSGLAVADGKVLLSTRDGAVYAFGLRSAASAKPKVTVIAGPAPVEPAERNVPEQASAAPLVIPQCGQQTTTFNQRCTMCHGADGKGREAMHTPNFTDLQWQSSKTDQELVDVLTNGNDHGMPAFGGTLSSQEINQIIHCVVRGFAPAPQGR
jgi:outer membrane protein assembly factor BamB